MDRFSAIVTRMDDAIWSMLLVALCLGVGLFLSLRMRFPQLRLLKEMGRVLKNGEEDGNGITPFQAFATTVGARGSTRIRTYINYKSFHSLSCQVIKC